MTGFVTDWHVACEAKSMYPPDLDGTFPLLWLLLLFAFLVLVVMHAAVG